MQTQLKRTFTCSSTSRSDPSRDRLVVNDVFKADASASDGRLESSTFVNPKLAIVLSTLSLFAEEREAGESSNAMGVSEVGSTTMIGASELEAINDIRKKKIRKII